MKATVSFTLDLSDFPAYNADDVESIPEVLQNLGSLFHDLHIAQLQKKCRMLVDPSDDKAIQDALLDHTQQDIDLTDLLFDNWRVTGTTDDGHEFEFTHQEPGYKETFLVDGEPQ